MALQPLDFGSMGESSRPLRVNNVRKRLGLSERAVRYLAETKRLPAFKIDKKSWGFRVEDVERYRLARENADEF